jgi:DNA-binding PadR family transcriptional regulator
VKQPLSEIEGCVLALIHESGPATPYAIRRDFLDSPTPQWSGSAGTIYPLVERLQRRGLIRSKLRYTGDRPGSQLSLTAAGVRTFRKWLSVPVPEWVAGIPPDPLRTRVRFLAALPLRVRREFIAEAVREARRQLHALEQDCERQRALGPFHHLMSRGALLTMQARLAFLDETAKALSVKGTR